MSAEHGRPVIELSGVRREFGDVRAIEDVSLTVHRGEVLGLLGHNGAGKTTLVRLIAGLFAPTGGTIRVEDRDPVVDGIDVRRRLGVLPTGPFLDIRLTARHNLRFAAETFGVERAGLDERIDALLEEFELTDRAGDRVEGFSAGMRQRLALARILLPGPEILLLDEPSASLDPIAVRQVRELIGRQTSEQGRTVVVCTHDLSEAQLLCDRVAVLDHGRVVALGTPAELGASVLAAAVEVVCDRRQLEQVRGALTEFGPAPPAVVPEPGRGEPGRGELSRGELGRGELSRGELSRGELNRDGHTATLRLDRMGADAIPDLVRQLASAGVDVYGVRRVEPSLEEAYVALQERLAEQEATTASNGRRGRWSR